ncbi:hypothetical protein [Haloplanus pelagicus]|uniref:hypothetical protein n=1 Tax=Haloplanus pelagicus TaxID=2949995 RepID=UPI00204113BE|nr:hypothetical protein [Haloplanus sp. HW8-1]
MRSTHIEAQRSKVYRRMVREDGATAAGNPPPAKHIDALDAAEGPEEFEEIRAAHAEGRGPPGHAGGDGRGPQ